MHGGPSQLDRMVSQSVSLYELLQQLDSKVSQLNTKVSQLNTKVSQLNTKVSQLNTKVSQPNTNTLVYELDYKVRHLDLKVSDLHIHTMLDNLTPRLCTAAPVSQLNLHQSVSSLVLIICRCFCKVSLCRVSLPERRV